MEKYRFDAYSKPGDRVCGGYFVITITELGVIGIGLLGIEFDSYPKDFLIDVQTICLELQKHIIKDMQGGLSSFAYRKNFMITLDEGSEKEPKEWNTGAERAEC